MAPVESDGPEEEVSRPRFVRPYTITSGRTHATVDLPMEATLRLETARAGTSESAAALAVLEVCDRRSVAECAALVKMPIGVVRVLLSDLVEHGFIRVQATITENSSKDERIELIERTLRGLRTY